MNDLLFNLAWLTVLVAVLPAMALMAVTWVVARLMDNWSIVDVAWSYGFALAIGLTVALMPGETAELVRTEWATNPVLWLGAAMGLWSLRLGTHLAVRILGHLREEDGRYRRMREQHGAKMPWRMAVFYFQQALALAILLLPFVAAAADGGREPAGPVHLAGLALFVAGLAIESRGDAQLRAFKADPANRGKVCDIGLWAWTRHPNYFGEFLIWLGFAALSFTPTLLGLPGLACAGGILHLVTNVTGIPLTEAQLLASKGDAYRAYQSRVPAFWPRRPR